MLAVLEQLLVVQDRDSKIRDLEKLLARLPLDEQQAKKRLAGNEAALADAKAKYSENEVAIKNLQLQVGTCQQTIGRLKTQQYETRKNEEFRALGHEIERYQTQINGLEDQELELMEKGEALKATLTEATASLANTKKLVEEELSKLSARQQSVTEELAGLRAERLNLTKTIEPTVFSFYDRLSKNKGNGVVRVDNKSGVCGGCHVKVTTATLHKARAEKEVTHCDYCGRLLYVIEDD